MKKNSLRTAAALLAAVLLCPCQAQAMSAQKAILVDACTGRVLYEKDADSRSLIASTTKIMTALVVCEQCNVLDRVKIPKEAVGIEGSSIYLKEGEILTVQDLLYGMMLHSGNDAAVALAIFCGGTVEGFAELMNDKARSLGMTGSHFVNPNGLDAPDHYSTARDLAILGAAAMENPIFAKTVSTKTVNAGTRALKNHNKLLWKAEGVDGIKTGYTKAAGRILVSSAVRQGRRLVAVTINDGDDWADHCALYEEGFSKYKTQRIIEQGQILGSVELFSGTEPRVNVCASEEFSYALSADETTRIVLSPPEFAYAPVIQGKQAGVAYVLIGEKVVGKVAVTYEKTVKQSVPPKKHFWDRWFGG